MESNKTLVGLTLAVVFAIFSTTTAVAQKVKYWVNFTDKKGTPFSLNKPAAFLTQKSIARRTTYHIPMHESDLPVTPQYITQTDAVDGVEILYVSKWLNGAVIRVDTSTHKNALATVMDLPFVKNTGKVNRYQLTRDPESPNQAARIAAAAAVSDYGRTRWQIMQLNLHCLHEEGFRGQGMTIAVCDAGFEGVLNLSGFDSLRNRGGILGTRDFVDGDMDPFHDGVHGAMVLSCMAAILPGQYMGTAPLADYWLLKTEEGGSETISEEYNWIRAAEFADSVGADIITTSLGYTFFNDPTQNHSHASLDGRTAPMSIASTMAARKGIFVLNAAGNEGDKFWRKISVAADADSVCAVGAVDSTGKRVAFSGMGPTADGRIKPDVMACGAGAYIHAYGVVYPASGTSFATPIMAGAVACYWQMHRYKNNIEVLNHLREIGTHASRPDTLMGWGIPRFDCKPREMDFEAHVDRRSSQLTVRLSPGMHKNVDVRMYDLSGKTVFIEQLTATDKFLRFNTATLTENIYLVKVSSSLGEKSKKVVRN